MNEITRGGQQGGRKGEREWTSGEGGGGHCGGERLFSNIITWIEVPSTYTRFLFSRVPYLS